MQEQRDISIRAGLLLQLEMQFDLVAFLILKIRDDEQALIDDSPTKHLHLLRAYLLAADTAALRVGSQGLSHRLSLSLYHSDSRMR